MITSVNLFAKISSFIFLTFIAGLALSFGQTPAELDPAFMTGRTTTKIGGAHDRATATAIQADGKIVVAGSTYDGEFYDFAVARYNADGTLDRSFGSAGKVTVSPFGDDCYASAVAIQPDDNKSSLAELATSAL